MRQILIAGPAIEPVSLAEAKSWLRVDSENEDALILALIASARMVLEAHTHQLFIEQSWLIRYDDWPNRDVIEIPLTPFIAIDVFQIVDAAGAPSAISPSTYTLDAAPQGARIGFLEPPPSTDRRFAGVELTIRVGYGANPIDVPAPLRQAVMMLTARWYENRGDATADAHAMPPEIAALVSPYRRLRFA